MTIYLIGGKNEDQEIIGGIIELHGYFQLAVSRDGGRASQPVSYTHLVDKIPRGNAEHYEPYGVGGAISKPYSQSCSISMSASLGAASYNLLRTF